MAAEQSQRRVVVVAAQKPFAKEAMEAVAGVAKSAHYTLRLLASYKHAEDLHRAVADADALIVRSDIVDEKVLAAAPRLRLVVRAGAGYDTIDTAACTKRGIVVMNTPGQNSNAVAELVFGFLISLARAGFSGKMGMELRGKRMGLHGYGNVARQVGVIARGFGMTVAAYDPFVSAAEFERCGVERAESVQEVFAKSDVVSVHVPLLKETRASVNAPLLFSMKKGAILINTARAEVMDDEALKEVMEKRPDFRYGTDVIPNLPFGAELKEKYGDRVLFSTAKCGAQTEEANTNCAIAAIHQTVNYFDKGDVRCQVNKPK
jgi:D-3-phosphoglycerate dehydrogenase